MLRSSKKRSETFLKGKRNKKNVTTTIQRSKTSTSTSNVQECVDVKENKEKTGNAVGQRTRRKRSKGC